MTIGTDEFELREKKHNGFMEQEMMILCGILYCRFFLFIIHLYNTFLKGCYSYICIFKKLKIKIIKMIIEK